MEVTSNNFFDHFKSMKDPRVERTKLHGMFEILFLTLCGVISDCEGWADIEDYGKSHIPLLRKYLPFQNGIPSDDTLRRFFRSVDSKELNRCFTTWIRSIVKQEHLDGVVIAIDGKTARGSRDDSQPALHLVSAFASDLRLILCQQKVAEKSNEILALPALLDVLDVRRAIVSIDAMGTQRTIAQKIQERSADYILALKKNQSTVYEEVATFFILEKKNSFKDVSVDIYKTQEKSHGRIEQRTCIVADVGDYISRRDDWAGLKSMICIESERKIKGSKTSEIRYYLSSRKMSAEKTAAAIRSHWAIENSVHWVLDMTFGEDQSRIRKENAPENIAVIRHIALNFLNNGKPAFDRMSIRRLRRMAGWQDGVLEMILSANF